MILLRGLIQRTKPANPGQSRYEEVAVAREDSDINIARIPVSGIGGLGMVVVAAVTAFAMPALRWLAAAALVGGIAIGLTLIGVRNRRARRASEIGGVILVLAVAVGIWIYMKW